MDALGQRSYTVGTTTPIIGGNRLVDVPPAAPALNEIADRVARIRDNVGSLGARLTSTADRAVGSVPTSGQTNGGAKVAPSGTTGMIFETLAEIETLVNYAHEQANRLERVA